MWAVLRFHVACVYAILFLAAAAAAVHVVGHINIATERYCTVATDRVIFILTQFHLMHLRIAALSLSIKYIICYVRY